MVKSDTEVCRLCAHHRAANCWETLPWKKVSLTSFSVAKKRSLCILLISLLTAFQGAECQLKNGGDTFNPFRGQGTVPPGFTSQNFTVHIRLTLKRLFLVDKEDESFGALFTSHLSWTDDRAYDQAMAPYKTCRFYCSSQGSQLVNVDGQAACCDGVFVPAAESRNANGFNSQAVPYLYKLVPLANGSVIYTAFFSGTWHCQFDYSSFPWDTHVLVVDVETGYLPSLASPYTDGAFYSFLGGQVVASQKTGPDFDAGSERALTRVLSVPGWQLSRMWMEVLNITQEGRYQDARTGPLVSTMAAESFGFRVYIQINRNSRVFYATVVILPTALIIVFSFVIFSLGRSQFKARITILLLLFLSLVLLQYVLSSVLPGTYSLLSPLYLVLVSYIYNFLLLFTSIASYALYMQHTRRSKRHSRMEYKYGFQQWTTALQQTDAEPISRPDVELDSVPATPPLNSIQRLQEENAVVESADKGAGLRLRRQSSAVSEARPQDRADCGHLEQAVDDIDEKTWVWFSALQQRWYVKRFPFTRDVCIWYKFVGQQNSRAYLDSLSHRVENRTRALLFVAYLFSIGFIFGYARSRVNDASESYALVGRP